MRRDFRAAASATAAALGADFATGRALSIFYAQTGRAMWLGAAVSAATFGAMCAMIAHLARRSGARSLPELLARMPGGPMGRGAAALLALFSLLAAGRMLAAAAHAGALALPLRRAGPVSVALALLLALACCLSSRAQGAASAALLGLMALYELGLLLSPPPEPRAMGFSVFARLWNRPLAAAALGVLHAAACACLAAGAALRQGGRARPARVGLLSGALLFLLLAGGCGALARAPVQALSLRLPFVALSAAWGAAGFCLSVTLAYMAALMSLAGALCGLLPRGWMLNYEKSPRDR